MSDDAAVTTSSTPGFDTHMFHQFLAFLPDAVVIVDDDGRIVAFNAQAEQMFRYSRDELLGQAIESLLPGSLRELRRRQGESHVAQPGARPMGADFELAGRRSDNTEFPATISLGSFTTEDHALVMAVIRDITERKQADDRRQQLIREQAARAEAEAAQRRMAFLTEATEVLSSSLDDETTLATVTRLMVPAIADLCVIDLLHDPSIRPIAVAHIDPGQEKLLREMRRIYPLDLSSAAPVAQVMRSGRSLLFPDVPDELQASVSTSEAHLDMLRRLGYRSAMIVPLIARGQTLGTIMIVSTSVARRYGPEDLALAEELARRAAIAIDNARLYAREQRARLSAERTAGRIARLQDVTVAIAGALTPTEIAEIVVDQGVDALGASAGSLALLNDEGSALKIIAAKHYPAEVLNAWLNIPLDLPVQATEAVRTGKPVWLPTWEEAIRRYPVLRNSLTTRSRSFAAVPLIVEEQVIGVMGLSFPEERDFNSDDRSFIVTLANQCALAIERARLYDAERMARTSAERTADRLIRLQEVASAVAGALTPPEIAEIVADQGVGALDAVASLILLTTADGTALETIAARGYSLDVLQSWLRIPLDVPVPVTEAARTGKPVWISTWEEATARYPILAHASTTGAKSFAAIPFMVEGEAIGAMGLSFREPRDFNQDERSFMAALANQCALAIERARLYDAEREARSEAEAAARVREEFLSIASHELKTPLTSIKAASQLIDRRLAAGAVTDERLRKLAGQLRSEIVRLETLVADLLDISRIQRGRLELRPETFDLAELAREVVERFGGASELTASHTIEVVASDPVEGTWDRNRLDQVLSNLLSNALKYSPEGGNVRVRLARDNDWVTMSVRDEGIGISAADLEMLFQPFARSDAARTLVSGTGLGLYITATIVEQHGGTISGESDLGKGSTFTVRLPMSVLSAERSDD